MNAWLNNTAFFALTFFAISTQAQSSYELTCRAKAKEIATQTYSSCITESRNAQVDRIRKEYQKQLADLKAKYDKELKSMSGKNTPAVKSASTPQAAKGIAKTLPTRKEAKNPAPSVHELQEEKTVITPDSSFYGEESESSQNDAQGDLSIQLIPAPASSDQTAASTGDPVY